MQTIKFDNLVNKKGEPIEMKVDDQIFDPERIQRIKEDAIKRARNLERAFRDNDAPNLQRWYREGIEIGATHLIVMTEEDEPFQPYYVMPHENVNVVEDRLCGGGHIFETYNLSKPIYPEQLTRFYKYCR